MPARCRSPWLSSFHASFGSQCQRFLGRLRVEHFDGDAEVDEHVIALTCLRNEGKRDDLAAAQPADPDLAVRPGLGEHVDRPQAHQAVSSSSTLSSRTPSAFGSVVLASSTASTTAPSAIVPREESRKCSPKCSGVKCESAPSRTEIFVTPV